MKHIALLLCLCLFAPLAHAQLTPIFQCLAAAETSILAVEEYLNDGATLGDISCTRQAKGGYQMRIETDCKTGNYPSEYNHVTIRIDKSARVCFSGSGSSGCEQIPGAINASIPQSNKDLAKLKKIYRNRCNDWVPPAP